MDPIWPVWFESVVWSFILKCIVWCHPEKQKVESVSLEMTIPLYIPKLQEIHSVVDNMLNGTLGFSGKS